MRIEECLKEISDVINELQAVLHNNQEPNTSVKEILQNPYLYIRECGLCILSDND